jgi:menaquinone-specific isochorismate synthase
MTAADLQSTRVVTRARRVDVDSTDVERSAETPAVVWRPPDGPRAVAVGVEKRLTAIGSDRFGGIREQATALFEDADTDGVPAVARPRLFGGGAFHADHEPTGPWVGFPGAEFVLPSIQLVSTSTGTWLTVTVAGPDATPERATRELERVSLTDDTIGVPATAPGVRERRSTSDRAAWREQVGSALDRIETGTLQKVVLAQALAVDLREDPDRWGLLRRLGATHPDCHRFCFQPSAEACFLGATPERLVSLEGTAVETAALAGSIGRGEDAAADDRLAGTLRESRKDASEHRIAVETIRDRLADVSASVNTGERTVRRLPTVQHLETPITATLSAHRHVLSLVDTLHPTPTVGGRPAEAARQTIRSLEPFERGWYAAPVGWFDAAGDGSFVVAIRSAVVRDRRATLFAGAGIVADSDPDEEWEEVQLKFRPVLDALE